MSSALVWRPSAGGRPRWEVVAIGLVLLGLVLAGVGLAQGVIDSASSATTGAPAAAPSIEVRARFAGLAPNDQSTGFAVAADGSLAIADRSQQRVLHLDPAGAQLAAWGPRFEADTDARDIGGVAAASDGWYLLDRGRGRILRLDTNGQATASIDLQPYGTYGPNGLATDARGNVYLADTGGNRILVFSPSGALVRTLGSAGSGLGQLKQPMLVSFGADGAMFVTDFENSRIERWGPDLQATDAWPLVDHAWGLAVDRLGRVFVPDADKRLVRIFGPRGDLLASIDQVPVGFPTQVGLSPDGSALWVLGNDGLARVDLGPYAQVVPVERSRGNGAPLEAAGAALALLGLAPLGWTAARGLRASRPWTAERTAVTVDDVAPPRPAEAPAAGPRGVVWLGARARALAWRERIGLAGGLGIASLGLLGAILAQVVLARPETKTQAWPWLGLLLGSGLVWAAGSATSARALPFIWLASWAGPAGRALPRRLSLLQVACAAGAVILGAAAAVQWWIGHFETQDATRALLVWLAALALALVACSGGLSNPRTWQRPSLLTWLVPLLLFLLALVPRLYHVADLPYGVWYDEAQGVVEVRRVVQVGAYTPILNTYGKDTSGFFYLIAGLWPLLGDTVLAARTAAALVGSLGVVAVFLLGRELFGWRVGLVAGLILAGLRWQLNFSRLGFNPISLPLCATLAVWLLARAVRRRSLTDLAGAGLALGLGLHAYTGFRGMPVVASFGFGLAALLGRWSPRVILPRLGVYVGAAVLAALPVLVFALIDPVTFNGRTAQTLIMTQPLPDAEKWRQIWDNVQRHLLMFQVSGDLNGHHNLPGAPMLDLLTGGLVVLGLGWLLIRPRDWRSLVLLAWAAVSLSGGILTLAFEAPQAVRTLGITPVIALLAGLGLVASLDRLLAALSLVRRVRLRRAAVALAGAGGLAVLAIGVSNLDLFFNRQMRDSAVFAAFSTRETVPAKWALDHPGGYDVILASTTMTPSVEGLMLVPNAQSTIRPFDPAGDLPYRGPGPGLIFLETEHDQALADEVGRMYGDASRLPIRAPDGGKPIVEGFLLTPEVLAAHRGIDVAYQGADGAASERVEARSQVTADAAQVALPAQVRWQSGLALDTTGLYDLRVPPGFDLRVDETPLPAAVQGGGVRLRLVRGNHRLEISGTLPPGGQLQPLWRPLGANEWQPLPIQTLFVPPSGGTGLVASLTALPEGSGQPHEEAVDPVLAHYYHVSPFTQQHIDPQQWAIEWRGQIEAPVAGSYTFALDHSQHAGLWIDEQPVLVDLPNGPIARTDRPTLSAGRHQIRVRFEKTTDGAPYVNLYWTPPGQPSGPVPPDALSPPPPEVFGPLPSGQ